MNKDRLEQLSAHLDAGGTVGPEIVRELIDELRAHQWQPIETAPRDGTPMLTGQLVRYLPYKPDGKRQMKKDGRWQAWDGYGWENIAWEPGEWLPARERKEGKNA